MRVDQAKFPRIGLVESVTSAASEAADKRTPPRIFKAVFGTGGDVIRGSEITEAEAIVERKAGRDVVVCGTDLPGNRDLAEHIESTANGNCKGCPPHAAMGPGALPHFQPDPRPPEGHSFYETTTRKSKKPRTPRKP